jgi:pimeloyl-ACP methyl ester carboxylesterase
MTTINIWVHGAFSSPQIWNYHKQTLTQHRVDVDIVYDITSDLMFDIAGDVVLQVMAHHRPGDKIVLYGHSYGGVIALAASLDLMRLGIDSEHITVVTLATPVRGIPALPPATIFGAMLGSRPPQTFVANTWASGPTMLELNNALNKQSPMCDVYAFVSTNNYGSVLFPGSEQNDGVVTVSSQVPFVSKPWCKLHLVDDNHHEIVLNDRIIEVLNQHAIR